MSAVIDPISDFLTRVRNALKARHTYVDVPSSKLKIGIAKIMMEHKFIMDFKVLEDKKQGILRILLRYDSGKPIIRGLRRISKPGIRRYVGVEKLPRVYNGLGIAVISTSTGIISDKKARQQKIGGEVLAYIW